MYPQFIFFCAGFAVGLVMVWGWGSILSLVCSGLGHRLKVDLLDPRNNRADLCKFRAT